jgi:hypothetical protein
LRFLCAERPAKGRIRKSGWWRFGIQDVGGNLKSAGFFMKKQLSIGCVVLAGTFLFSQAG